MELLMTCALRLVLASSAMMAFFFLNVQNVAVQQGENVKQMGLVDFPVKMRPL